MQAMPSPISVPAISSRRRPRLGRAIVCSASAEDKAATASDASVTGTS